MMPTFKVDYRIWQTRDGRWAYDLTRHGSGRILETGFMGTRDDCERFAQNGARLESQRWRDQWTENKCRAEASWF